MTRGPTLEQAKLAAELAALRERVGLSLSGLAQRTTASRSSWQRYLNGSKLPPRELVRELCELAQVPPGRLLALWQLADAARRDPAASRGTASEPQARAAASPVPEGAPEPPGRPHPQASREAPGTARADADAAGGLRHRIAGLLAVRGGVRRRLLGGVLAVGALLGLAGVGYGLLGASDPAEGTVQPGCRGEECTGEDSQSQACAINASTPRTVAERQLGERAVIDIRYSERCRAGWARVRFASVGDRIEIRAPGEGRQTVRIADRYDAEGYLSTRMVGAGPRGLEACLVSAATGKRHCFTS